MLTLDEIQERLRSANIAEVSRATGLHYNTCRSIRDGIRDNPTHKVMMALSRHFESKDNCQ